MKLGLYIIGDEILTGRRRDTHFAAVLDMLKKRDLSLSWVTVLEDDLDVLETHFRRSIESGGAVLCTGGIGGTPDDLTRPAMAKALGLSLTPHPEGVPILQRKFGDRLTAERRRMVEFPEGATLIPNPVNEIPGFSIAGHHCVPGFPEMAHPMMEWVLDRYYSEPAQKQGEHAVVIDDVPESRLIPLMEELLAAYPTVKVFSLPNISGTHRKVELGVRGPADDADRAFIDMQTGLKKLGLGYKS